MTREEAIKKWGLKDYAIVYQNCDEININALVDKGLIDRYGVQVQGVYIHADYKYAIVTFKTTAKFESDF